MILTAHQPVYLPWLGLFHKISLADTFCFFDDVQYEPRGWNNRNYIKGNNNEKVLLSVPVFSKGHRDKSYLEIQINNTINWQKKHWRSIETAYKKSPYFDCYVEELKSFYCQEWKLLVDLNFAMLKFFLKALNLDVEVVCMSDSKFDGTKSALVLDMCKKLGASKYVFGALGADYADVGCFKDANIDIEFQKYSHPVYDQASNIFTPNLSVIDLLFNHGEKALDIITRGAFDQ
jgi:hypothetical protein